MRKPHAGSASTLRLPPHREPTPTQTRLRTRRVPLALYAVTLLALPAVLLVAANTAGWWVTTGRPAGRTVAAGTGTNGPGAGTAIPHGEPAGAGQAGPTDPADVKGWMTVRQLLDAFPTITAADVYQLFGVPADTPTSTALKDLAEAGNGFDLPALRTWLDRRT